MKKHILLVDDAEETLTTLASILRKAGYDVTEAPNGQEALRQVMAHQKTPRPLDLLITDLWMEGLDGFDLIDQIQRLQIPLPVIVITGSSDKETVVQLMRRGCTDYIEKPFEAVELIQHVARVFKKAPTNGPAA